MLHQSNEFCSKYGKRYYLKYIFLHSKLNSFGNHIHFLFHPMPETSKIQMFILGEWKIVVDYWKHTTTKSNETSNNLSNALYFLFFYNWILTNSKIPSDWNVEVWYTLGQTSLYFAPLLLYNSNMKRNTQQSNQNIFCVTKNANKLFKRRKLKLRKIFNKQVFV